MPLADLALPREHTALLVVDVQEKLCAVLADGGAAFIANVDRLLEGARVLDVPVLVTEQYPKGLGPTVSALRDRIATFAARPATFEKLEFGAPANDAFSSHLDAMIAGGLRVVVVAGMEAHICVYQSVRGLVARGLAVHVALDATASRTPENLAIGRDLWSACGATVTSTETVLFDLVGRAGTDTFRAISRLVK